MEEFNGGSGGAGGGGGGGGGGGTVDSGIHCSNTAGTKEQLLTNCIAAQAQRLQHPSPGIRYRNLGKSGLRVSNVGLGTLNVFLHFHRNVQNRDYLSTLFLMYAIFFLNNILPIIY